MVYYRDLTPCDFFGNEFAPFLRAIGWLERDQPFATGNVEKRVYDKMKELGQNPWQPVASAGLHGCELCQYEPEAHGHSTLIIPGNGFLYLCPGLIIHYMNAHGYSPPLEFCDAVLACPAMRSVAYHKAILANGGRPLLKMVNE